MDSVQSISVGTNIDNSHPRDTMNNEISSTSSEDMPYDTINKISNMFNNRPIDVAVSDNEVLDVPPKRPPRMQARSHFKSMGNINDNDHNSNLNKVQSRISNIDISLHKNEIKKFDALKIPIVGYEVMEERARFTIYKLKVEDDKRDQSWLVFRRYTDFVRLYTRIKSEQPNLILPLPGKRWFRDNFEPAFIEERVKGLQIFVNGILDKIPNHPLVREFFCMDEPPNVMSYQPEVQAVYEALEDSISSLKMQLRQKDATLMHLQKRVAQLESLSKGCPNCSTNI